MLENSVAGIKSALARTVAVKKTQRIFRTFLSTSCKGSKITFLGSLFKHAPVQSLGRWELMDGPVLPRNTKGVPGRSLGYWVGTPIPQVDAPGRPKTSPWHATPNRTLRQPPLEVRLPRLSQGGSRTFGATTPGCLCDYLGLSVRLLGCLEVVAG